MELHKIYTKMSIYKSEKVVEKCLKNETQKQVWIPKTKIILINNYSKLLAQIKLACPDMTLTG